MLFQSLESKILKAQSDSQLLDKLIAAHQGFIRKCMIDQQKASGAQLEDEMTVAMLAFSEAVAEYDAGKGKFLSFARLVINRRMVDEYRRQLRQMPPNSRSFDEPLSEEEGTVHPYEAEASLKRYEAELKQSELQLEIARYEEALGELGLSFAELTEVSPKQDALRRDYQAVAKWLCEQPALVRQIYKDKKLPLAEIQRHFDMDRKKLERGRKYILAMLVLQVSDLEQMKTYLKGR